MRRFLVIFLVLVVLAAAAVAIFLLVDNGGDGSPTPTKEVAQEEEVQEEIGTIQREQTRVRYGPSVNDLEDLTGSRPLLVESALRVTDDGEALLDFQFGLVLRAFNNADMGVAVDTSPSSFLARFFLQGSVVTGDLVAQGNQIVWETPNGEEITISGTEFWIGYDDDPGSQQTVLGNFNGDVSTRYGPLPPGRGIILPSGTEFDITVTRADFERAMRGTGDPLGAMWGYVRPGQSVLFTYGGEPFGPDDMRNAMLYAVPWQDLAIELSGSDQANLFVAAAYDLPEVTAADRFRYNRERADVIFQEYGYRPPPGDDVWLALDFMLIVPEVEPYINIGEAAITYYENFGFGVALEPVPPEDYFAIVREIADSGGELFWTVGPLPENARR